MASIAALALLGACRSTSDATPKGPLQTERDERLRYELLDPTDHEFRITYEFAATTPGAMTYFTPVRGDTFVSEVTAEDLFTGKRLDVGLVYGKDARAKGHPAADPEGTYFLVALDRAVPVNGEVRLRLCTKYEDRGSYTFDGADCEFARLLAARSVELVLPPKHELVDCNVPVTMTALADGRIELAYEKRGPVPLPLRIRARRVKEALPAIEPVSAAGTSEIARARDSRRGVGEITRSDLDLDDVAASAARWRHDLVFDSTAGDAPPNVSFDGPIADLRVLDLDTGDVLVAEAKAPAVQPPDGEVGRIEWKEPARGRPTHVRFEFKQGPVSFHPGPDRAGILAVRTPDLSHVLLPAGWTAVSSTVPIAVTTRADGRVSLELARPDHEVGGVLLGLWRPDRGPSPAAKSEAPAPVKPATPEVRADRLDD